jgi:hypothetical protein
MRTLLHTAAHLLLITSVVQAQSTAGDFSSSTPSAVTSAGSTPSQACQDFDGVPINGRADGTSRCASNADGVIRRGKRGREGGGQAKHTKTKPLKTPPHSFPCILLSFSSTFLSVH